MLDAKALQELRELESKATPAPWDYDRDTWWENTPGEQEKEGNLIIHPKNDEDLIIAEVNDQFDKEQGKANAMLFTVVRNNLPALLDAAEACESWRNAYNHACRERDRYDQNEREITEEAAALMRQLQVLADENKELNVSIEVREIQYTQAIALIQCLRQDFAAKDKRISELAAELDNHYATSERLWKWAREVLNGEAADQFWQIAANGHLMDENPKYQQRINMLKRRVEELEQLRTENEQLRGNVGGYALRCHQLQADLAASQEREKEHHRQYMEMLEEYKIAEAERDRYLALLKEIATVKDHTENREKMTIKYTVTLESIQRHVRQQLEKWGVNLERSGE